MPDRSLNTRIPTYKKALADGQLQQTYQRLVGIVQSLRSDCLKRYKGQYSVANILHGYLDVTYFYLQDNYLKENKLKLAIVFNHPLARFELWLLGQTKDIQIHYWEALKDVEWVDSKSMPEYSIAEIVLLSEPDFDAPQKLFDSIYTAFDRLTEEIVTTLKSIESP